MKILMVLEAAGGGAGRHVLDLATHLVRRQHEVMVAYSGARADQEFLRRLSQIPGIRSIAVPMKRRLGLSDLYSFRSLRNIVNDFGPFDILHGHSSKAGALVRLLPKRLGARVYTAHAMRIMDPSVGRAVRKIYAVIEFVLGQWRSEAIIAVSADEANVFSELGISRSHVTTIVNGVDPAVTASKNDDVNPTFGAGLPADAHIFGFVGRLTYQKAPERLVASFAIVSRAHEGARLIIVGDGERMHKLRHQVESEGIADRVYFAGSCQAAHWFQRFDTLVMPSRYEAMPYVLLEAMAEGLPIVSTDVSGARVVIDEGYNGIIVANEDKTQQLSAALQRCMNVLIHQRMRTEAAARRGYYPITRMIDETENLYRKCLNFQ